MKADADHDRRQDAMYCMLVQERNEMRTKLVHGIKEMIKEHTQHPAVLSALSDNTSLAEKAFMIAALHAEPDFLAYVLDIPTCCSSAVSEWAVVRIPPLIKRLLDGTCTMHEFLEGVTHSYITL